jgi:hypothetical protein
MTKNQFIKYCEFTLISAELRNFYDGYQRKFGLNSLTEIGLIGIILTTKIMNHGYKDLHHLHVWRL